MKKVIYSMKKLQEKYKKIAKSLYSKNRSIMERLKSF